ncbi:putative Prophage CP4-57 regulatory protein [Escherichia coli]|nr:putative Prophage CP4-57 regulatory protein [Escherichia coli]
MKHPAQVIKGLYPSIMLPVYLPTGIFPYSFFTFLPSCYASEGGAFFITNAG